MDPILSGNYLQMVQGGLYAGQTQQAALKLDVEAQLTIPVSQQQAMMTGGALGLGWGGFGGGLQGMGQMYQYAGLYAMAGMLQQGGGGLAYGAGFEAGFGGVGMEPGAYGAGFEAGYAGIGMEMPGMNALGLAGMVGMGGIGAMNNTIQVAGTGMGASKKYDMYPGEFLAVYSEMKDSGKSMKPDQLASDLKDKFGIDAEVKTVDGKKAVVNAQTGHTLMVDGNGNGVMDMGDMKFNDTVKQLKDQYGIDANAFATQEKNQPSQANGVGGVNPAEFEQLLGGLGTTAAELGMGYGGIQGLNPAELGMGYGGIQGLNPAELGMGYGGLPGAEPMIPGSPTSNIMMPGMMPGQTPQWLNEIMQLFAMAMRYAEMFGGGQLGGGIRPM